MKRKVFSFFLIINQKKPVYEVKGRLGLGITEPIKVKQIVNLTNNNENYRIISKKRYTQHSEDLIFKLCVFSLIKVFRSKAIAKSLLGFFTLLVTTQL